MNPPVILLDALSPFMAEISRHRINWSKIPFADLEKDGMPEPELWERIQVRFAVYCKRIREDGATAVALDDLAHLYVDSRYPEDLKRRLDAYREQYRRLMDTCNYHGLDVYVNSDILFYTRELRKQIGMKPAAVTEFLKHASMQVLDEFPQLKGIQFRLGECDGQDVHGDFLSELVLHTPQQTNQLLKSLLPLFADRDSMLILRTWTVGAYPIGDLIWNGATLLKLIQDLESHPHLVLSMKYGESDFFRYLKLNKHFFRSPVQKMVELQTRREYEGCGEFPSFVGYDYEQVLRELESAENLWGVQVWCQTGGWTSFRRLTYLMPEAVWNEINTFVTLRMARDGIGVEEALSAYVWERKPDAEITSLTHLMRLSHEVMMELFYVEAYARQPVYFRRLRLPPQLMVYWDHIFVNHTLRKVLRCFVEDPEAAIRQGEGALLKIEEMKELSERCALPRRDIEFMQDSFELLALAREYALLPYTKERVQKLHALKDRYKERWTDRYRFAVKLDFEPQLMRRSRMRWMMKVLFRQERRYRRLDRLVVLWLLGKLYPLLRLGGRRFTTGFMGEKAMGVGTVFR